MATPRNQGKRRRKARKVALEQGSSLPPKGAQSSGTHDETAPRFWVLDDVDNADLFANLHHEKVRYVGTWRRWYRWNGSVWCEDTDAVASTLAKNTAKQIRTESRKSGSRDYERHAKHSASRSGVDGMLKLAESDDLIRMSAGQFDRDPWLLNVANGTIDLRTGALHKHEREDYITKIVDIEFVSGARRNMWDAFLERMVPDCTLRDYLQRAVGYTLTGLTDEQKFFLVFGRGASGKGTFIEALHGIMGTHATVADFRLFLESNKKRFDLWRHAYSRMISAQEVREGQRFDEGTVKLMVGGDIQTAERKYCDQFQFTPRWTVWLGANTRPHIDAGDDAMWRRIRIIPFTNSLRPEQRDPRVRAMLGCNRDVQKRILAWAVKGAQMWSERRLDIDEPAAVTKASIEYRTTADNFAEFFANTLDVDPDGFTPSAIIQEKYDDYCADNAEEPINRNELARRLREMGFEPARSRIGGGEPVRGWKGFLPRP